MAAFDNLSFDANAFDAAAAPGRFGISLPSILAPRARRGTGLVWLAFPRYFGLREAVSGGVGSLLTAGGYSGHSFASTALDTGGAAFPFSGRLKSINSAWTLLWYGSLTTLSGSGDDALLTVPAAGTWASPYSTLTLRRLGATSRLYAAVHDGTNTHNGTSSTGVVSTDERAQLYAVTYDAGQMAFYKDGASAGVTGSTSGTPGWGSEVGVVVSGRHPTDIGASPIAACVMAAIFNRTLSQGEIATIARDPASLVEPVYVPTAYSPPVIPAPSANFTVTPASGVAPLTVQMTDTSTGAVSWAWDYQDNGSTDSTLQNPQYTYSAAGTYTIRLTVTNTSGSSSITRQVVVSAPPPPVITPGATYTLQMDFGRTGDYAHPQSVITSRLIDASWSIGMADPLQEFATPSRLTLTLDNVDSAWSPDKVGATYRGLLVPGVLVRLQTTFSGVTYTLWTGKVKTVVAAPGSISNEAGGWKQVRITAEDAMTALLEAEYDMPLLLNVRTDQAMKAIFDAGVFTYPYDKDWFRWDISQWDLVRWYDNQLTQFDEGYTIIPWAGDNLEQERIASVQTLLREFLAAEAGGRFFWQGRLGKFVFHNRYRDNDAAIQATVGEEYVTGVAAEYAANLANVITLNYQPRTIGAANTVLWESEKPFTLRPEQERTINARFRDATNKTAKIAALVVLPIQPGDFTALDVDQGRADRTGSMGISMETKANSATIRLKNPNTFSVEVTVLKVRGTPLTTFSPDKVMVSDRDSIIAYDIHEMTLSLSAIADPEYAEGIAGTHLVRQKTPTNRWRSINLRMNYTLRNTFNTTMQGLVIQRTIGDCIRAYEPWSGHDAEYIIVGEQHTLDARSLSHQVTWVLKPKGFETWFKWDVSEWDGGDVFPL